MALGRSQRKEVKCYVCETVTSRLLWRAPDSGAQVSDTTTKNNAANGRAHGISLSASLLLVSLPSRAHPLPLPSLPSLSFLSPLSLRSAAAAASKRFSCSSFPCLAIVEVEGSLGLVVRGFVRLGRPSLNLPIEKVIPLPHSPPRCGGLAYTPLTAFMQPGLDAKRTTRKISCMRCVCEKSNLPLHRETYLAREKAWDTCNIGRGVSFHPSA